MATLLDPEDRAAILERIRRLTPTHARRWGTMDAHRMVCHAADQLRVALGDTPIEWRYPAVLRPLLKMVAVRLALPAPRGRVPTVPEMLTTRPAEWAADLAALEELVERMGHQETFHPHPAFGRMSAREWGGLGWRHLDHHLRQFGE